MIIELIYDLDCPNVAKARANLAAALTSVGREARWTEWDRTAPDSPSYVRGFGSPTVLVNGQDVWGEPTGGGGSCCRLYRSGPDRFDGAPSVELIAASLPSNAAIAMKGTRLASGWKSSLVTLPATAAALLPAGLCPACWPAYAGVLSTLGLGFLLDTAYLFPLTAVLLAVAVAALAMRAQKRHGYGPFFVGLAASTVVLLGKFMFESNVVTYGGIAALIVASIWNASPVGKKDATCPACESV